MKNLIKKLLILALPLMLMGNVLGDHFSWGNVENVIEIGNHLGASTIFLANRISKNKKIYILDLKADSNQFLSNMLYENLTDRVIPIFRSSIEEAKRYSHRVKLIYFHRQNEEIYQDLAVWYPKVAIGGVACGTSATQYFVLAKVKQFAGENKLTVTVKGDLWLLSPKNPRPLHPVRSCPWVVDRANDFLETFMEKHPHARILEFGSGSSTLWFAKRTSQLVSIEHNPNWYELIQSYIETKSEYYSVEYYLHPLPYYSLCQSFPKESFDLIVVDGRNRKGCMSEAVSLLKPGGVLMLDNSERSYYRSAFSLVKGWKSQAYKQIGPDREGFCYQGWETRWWIKPK